MHSPRFERRSELIKLTIVTLIVAIAAITSNSTLAVEAAPLDARVTSPGNGFISLGVYDSGARLVRSLAAAKAVTAGEQHFAWDGTTDLGLPVTPGGYAVRGVWFPQGRSPSM